MTVAFDFDGTWAVDPTAWVAVVGVLRAAGHTCIMVTQRTPEMAAQVHRTVGTLIPILFAGGRSKRAAAEKAGYHVDVWVDDVPASIDMALLYVGP